MIISNVGLLRYLQKINFSGFNTRSCLLSAELVTHNSKHQSTSMPIGVTVTTVSYFPMLSPYVMKMSKNVIIIADRKFILTWSTFSTFRLMTAKSPAIPVGHSPVANASYSSKMQRGRYTHLTLKLMSISPQQQPFLLMTFILSSKVSYLKYIDNSTKYFPSDL